MFTELDDVLDRLQQGPSQAARPLVETTDTSGDESVISPRKKKLLSKKTYKMKKAWATDELARLFVTGDPVAKPSHFYCQLCWSEMSVPTHESLQILRHCQGAKHFAMDQRLSLETPGWRVRDFGWISLPDDEVERQPVKITRTPLVRRDRENPYCEDLITDDAGVVNPQLPILAKVSSLLQFLRLDGSYELVEQLWAQFSLTTSCVNIEVCWSRNELLVSIPIYSVLNTYLVSENYVSVPEKYVSVPENYVSVPENCVVPHFHY